MDCINYNCHGTDKVRRSCAVALAHVRHWDQVHARIVSLIDTRILRVAAVWSAGGSGNGSGRLGRTLDLIMVIECVHTQTRIAFGRAKGADKLLVIIPVASNHNALCAIPPVYVWDVCTV